MRPDRRPSRRPAAAPYSVAYAAAQGGGGGGGVGGVPVVLDQALSFGRLTLSGAGATVLVNNGGPITSIALGTRTVGSNHFTTSGATVLPSAVPSDAQYVWTGCTASGPSGTSATFTLTIDTEASTYSVVSMTEVKAAAAAIGVGGGKTIKCRSGSYSADVDTFKNRAFTSTVTLTSYTAKGAVFAALDINNTDFLTVDNVSVIDESATTGVLLYVRNTSASTTIQNCLIRSAYIDPAADYSGAKPARPYGISKDGTTAPSDVSLLNNEIYWVDVGISMACTGTLSIQGNYVHDYYEDGIKISGGSSSTVASWNVVIGGIANSTDAGNPHPDMLQFIGQSGSDWTGIEIDGNRLVNTYTRSNPQGIFVQGMSAGLYFTAKVRGNVVINTGNASVGIRVQEAKDCEIYGNTVASNLGILGTGPGILIGETRSSGTQLVSNNAADSFAISGASTQSNNVTMGSRGVTIPYTTAYDGPTFAPTTLTEAMSMYDLKAGGPLDLEINVGAIGSGYVTWPATAPGSPGTLDDAFTSAADQFGIFGLFFNDSGGSRQYGVFDTFINEAA